MKKLLNWSVERLKEVSTWQGLTVALSMLGVVISPELTSSIVGAGSSVFVLLSVILKEKK